LLRRKGGEKTIFFRPQPKEFPGGSDNKTKKKKKTQKTHPRKHNTPTSPDRNGGGEHPLGVREEGKNNLHQGEKEKGSFKIVNFTGDEESENGGIQLGKGVGGAGN